MVAFAGSIGIIGIALILSVSNGFQLYIDKNKMSMKHTTECRSINNPYFGFLEK